MIYYAPTSLLHVAKLGKNMADRNGDWLSLGDLVRAPSVEPEWPTFSLMEKYHRPGDTARSVFRFLW